MTQQETFIHQRLDHLRTRLLMMGVKTQQALADANTAIRNKDLPRAAAVLDGDSEIDDLENEIDEASLNLLARSQPVAKDLRFIMAAVRMVLDLERIGDEAVTIAERAMLSDNLLPRLVEKDLTDLMARSQEMLRNALNAFCEEDAAAALAVSRYDEETAQMIVAIFQKLMQQVREQSVDAWDSMHLILITHALDRVCRRAENIAEHTYFMLEGVSLKHRPQPPFLQSSS